MRGNEEHLVLRVVTLIQGGWRSRELIEAENPEFGSLESEQVLLCNCGSLVHRQGMVLAHLSRIPSTRAQLHAEMSGLLESTSVWIEAKARGEPMTGTLFAQGLTDVLTVQRAAIRRVAREQVEDPEPIWAALAKVSLPNTEIASQGELIQGVGKAMVAHVEALVAIARDLEGGAGAYLGGIAD